MFTPSAAIGAQLQGLGQVLERMRTLAPKLQKKGLSAAVRRGANIVKNAAKENSKRIDDKETQNAIWKNIAIQASAKYGRRVGGVVMRVGVRGGANVHRVIRESRGFGGFGKTNLSLSASDLPGGDTRHWRLIEFGTSRFEGKHFMVPALANNVESATSAIVEELNVQIDKALAQ